MAKRLKSISMSMLQEVNVDTAKEFIQLVKWDCPSDYECLGEYEIGCSGTKYKSDCYKCWEQAIMEYVRNEEEKDV